MGQVRSGQVRSGQVRLGQVPTHPLGMSQSRFGSKRILTLRAPAEARPEGFFLIFLIFLIFDFFGFGTVFRRSRHRTFDPRSMRILSPF